MHNLNLNLNYNFMGFDTIEINQVYLIYANLNTQKT